MDWRVFAALSSVSAVVFLGYGALFAAAPIRRGYLRAGRWIKSAFGVLFGAAGLRLLSTRIKAKSPHVWGCKLRRTDLHVRRSARLLGADFVEKVENLAIQFFVRKRLHAQSQIKTIV